MPHVSQAQSPHGARSMAPDRNGDGRAPCGRSRGNSAQVKQAACSCFLISCTVPSLYAHYIFEPIHVRDAPTRRSQPVVELCQPLASPHCAAAHQRHRRAVGPGELHATGSRALTYYHTDEQMPARHDQRRTRARDAGGRASMRTRRPPPPPTGRPRGGGLLYGLSASRAFSSTSTLICG